MASYAPLPTGSGGTAKSSAFVHMSMDAVVAELRTSLAGLSTSEALGRLTVYGDNSLEIQQVEPLWLKFAEQFKNPLIAMLLASAGISLLLGELEDAVSIALAIVIVVSVAFVQEYRSEQSLQQLNKLVPHYCRVMRDGNVATLQASALVPGDVVHLSTGDRIPADMRLAQCTDFEVDESSLTERRNMAFMGTHVRHGHAIGVVVATGKDTEFGVVFHMMKDVEEKKTPLQLKMDVLGKQLSAFSVGLIAVIVLVGVIQQRGILEMFTIGVSLAVAAIPEGLPIVVTVTLALGVLRMAKHNAIVKKLPSVESLGSVNVICVDKTGTLTTNNLTVTRLFTVAQNATIHLDSKGIDPNSLKHPAVAMLSLIGNLCNNAGMDASGTFTGQPTEIAILQLVQSLKQADERPAYTKSFEIPFSSERKYMAVQCRRNTAHSHEVATVFVKGAVEVLLRQSTHYFASEGDIRALDSAHKQLILSRCQHYASEGLRILGMAYGKQNDLPPDGTIENLIFVGFIAMCDPPRQGITEAVSILMAGGVRVAMITGDSEGTALSVMRQVGLYSGGAYGSTMSGQEIDKSSERQLAERISSVSVFYRTTPKHKLAIIKAYQASGAVVAMMGDGVNDAPALRLADIGVSMGKSGTDVSKEAADMILVDDNFTTVLYAIEEGKGIFYNIRNFLRFQLSTSMSALFLIASCTILGLPNPLNAMQILWINILCDGPVAQSLGVEAVDPAVMKEPPRPKEEPIVTRNLIMNILLSAGIIVAGTLFIYHGEVLDGVVGPRGTTMTFTCFVFYDMFNALTCRSATRSVLDIGLFSNNMFNIAVSLCVCGQLALIYVPFLQKIFQTEALSGSDIFKLVCLASCALWGDEIRKYYEANNQKTTPSRLDEAV